MNDYRNLNLNAIKNQLKDFANIDEAKAFIDEEMVDFNPLVIRKKTHETKEAIKILNDGNNVSFDGIINVSDILTKAEKQIMLTGMELKSCAVFHNHCNRIKKQFQSFDEDLSIRDYSDGIYLAPSIFEEIDDLIEVSGEVKEDATPVLKQINKDLQKVENDLYSKAYQFMDRNGASLQEKSIIVRNDRLTFLVKSNDKNKFKGYTYGTSSSGLAYYIEPQSFIELNNQKISLLQDKEDEIARILVSLSYKVASVSQEYQANFNSLVQLCVIFAKARYGQVHNAIIPVLSDDPYFDFKDLCHPLIDENKVVSNSYRIYEPYHGIVISGSNTGGKTVSLKAIGLSIVMTYLGIPIIASEAKIPLYDHIFVDIDDNQSIENSLSTFSAHITNINDILNQADDTSLILIDELISGTDPKQAQAISLSILDKIKALGSIFVITTHFDDIKKYSYEDENIMLSSVGFNMETLAPTYHYYENSVGSSNALEIASRYIDDPELIQRAYDYLKLNQTKQDMLLDELSQRIDETNQLKEELTSLEKELKDKNQVYQDKIKEFEKEKSVLKEKYMQELRDYIEEVKEKAQDKLDSIHDMKTEVVDEIDELVEEPAKEEPVVFQVGDNVRISDNEQVGTILSINNDTVSIDIRGITVKTKIDRLTLMPKTTKKKAKVESKHYSRVPMEINVVGERVEDALDIVEEYLDKANAAKMSQVKVIHGIGTGALRNALRTRMKSLSYIKSFKDGDYHDGGSAVTMVEFKK
ncbi:MAG: Smr/MutS family protein [Erysipelotrichaceae bacterium]|nr:Smr/MutS family protein [Erysipelotrichaceae bacterium]